MLRTSIFNKIMDYTRMLKKSYFRLIIVLLSLLSSSLYSQLQIVVDMDQVKFIQHEAVDVTLHVINNSGSQLSFGNDQGKIDFLIVSEINNFSTLVAPYGKNFNPADGLIIGSGETKKITVRVNKFFDLAKAMKYRLKARISHPRLQFATETKNFTEFEVAEGDVLKTRNFGVADFVDPNRILTRTYAIIGFNEKNHSSYCLKIYDDKWVYALHRLGPRVRGVEIQDDIDSFSNIHVLIQLEPRVFSHVIYSPDGNKQQEVIYRASFDNVPVLTRDPDLGKISVRDGLRATEGVDYVRQGDKIKMLN
jgi:hypothetical protein